MDNKYKKSLDPRPKIIVMDEIYSAGVARAEVHLPGYTFPYDGLVTAQKGGKRVMLRNVQQAKFSLILTPISKRVLDAGQAGITFDALFLETLFHELMYSVGPKQIEISGANISLLEYFGDSIFTPLNEAKANIMSLWAIQYLVQRGIINSTMDSYYTTYLANTFRGLRFGIQDPTAQGWAIQLNYLLEQGGIYLKDTTQTFGVQKSMTSTVSQLVSAILNIMATGDKTTATTLVSQYGILGPTVASVIGRLDGIPIELEPLYQSVQQ